MVKLKQYILEKKEINSQPAKNKWDINGSKEKFMSVAFLIKESGLRWGMRRYSKTSVCDMI